MDNKIPFSSKVAVLEQYIHSKAPEKDLQIASLIMESLKRDPDLRRYFFSNRPNSAWIPLLWENGFFEKPPDPDVTAQGSFIAYWDVHEYICSVANDVPDYFIKHISHLDSCYDWYKARAINSLINLPFEKVSSIMPKVLEWLKRGDIDWSLSNDASELMSHFAKEGHADEAFSIFSALTMAVLKPGTDKNSHFIFDHIKLKEHSPISHYEPDNQYLKVLEQLNTGKLIEILEQNLREAITVEGAVDEINIYENSFWRSAIEDSDQDMHDSAKDSLLRALRDAINYFILFDVNNALQIIERYLSDRYEIFHRLGLYFLGRYPENLRDHVQSELMKFQNLDANGIHHEFFLLLASGFPYLNNNQQEKLIQTILQGPPQEEFEEFVQSVAEREGIDPNEFRKSYRNHWIKNRLWMIKTYLSGIPKAELEKLVLETGEPDHPTFLVYSSEGGWIKDISPVDQQQLGSMSPRKLYEFINSWEPDPLQHFSLERISWIGLGASVAELLVSTPQKYSDYLISIASFRPELANSIFGLLTKENYPIREMDSKIWLNLGLSLLKESLEAPEHPRWGRNNNWSETYRSMIKLVRRLVENEETSLPADLLKQSEEILSILVYNPDPDQEQDRPTEGWFGHLDPLTVSINHVRPMALEALINLAIKKAQSCQDQDPPKWDQSIRDILTKKLDRKSDPSWSVHSVYGRYFVSLYWMDKDWVISNIDSIFPEYENEESIWYFVAAWDSFILSQYRPYLMPILKGKYEKAIDYLVHGFQTKSSLEVQLHFAIHIILAYLLDDDQSNSNENPLSLVRRFFLIEDPIIRSKAARACWLIIKDNPRQLDIFWPRIKAIWEWRSKEASIHGHSSYFDDEILEFTNLPILAPESETIQTLWPLLEGFLPHLKKDSNIKYDWIVLEKFLLKEVDGNPVMAIQYSKMMYSQMTEKPRWIHHSDEAIELIRKAYKSGNSGAREIAYQIIDNFFRWGDKTTFADLY